MTFARLEGLQVELPAEIIPKIFYFTSSIHIADYEGFTAPDMLSI